MKMNIMKVVLSWGMLGLLLLLPITSSALSTYNTETGYLSIPEVKVNGNTFYDNVDIRLNFTTGTFELVSGDERPETSPSPSPGGISTTPIETYVVDNVLNVDFMGCERSNSSVTCHVNYTSLGGHNREVEISAGYWSPKSDSKLYDSNGFEHNAIRGSIGNVKTNSIGTAKILLVAGVPTLAKFKFNNISPEKGLSLFKPRFSFDDGYYEGIFHP